MNWAEFHFAQPEYLWGLLCIPAGILWHLYCRRRIKKHDVTGLEKFADKPLLPHLLLNAYKAKGNVFLGWLFALVITLSIIALANPRWKFEEIEAFTPTASMVILLDLGEQMSARDLVPSRVIRARQYIEDLLNASRGLKIGLIGFAANPHLISPITDDLQTLKNYLPAVDTFLIHKQGDNFGKALRAAEDLLNSEPGVKKSILLMSAGNFVDNDFTDIIAALTAKGITLHVMGMGTLTGAPYEDQTGKMRRDNDALAISKLNQAVLKVIAKKGNGIYVDGNHAMQGISTILHKAQQIESNEPLVSGKVRQWEDSYYWFLIPVMLLLGFLITQRAFYIVVISITCSLLHSNDAWAFEVATLFKNPDQQAQQQFDTANFAEAAELFKDPYRKGVAFYRAGNYIAAEEEFNAAQRGSVKIAALYNAGNSQMQQKKWRAAVASYEKVLELQADHADAKHNLELAKKMLQDDDCECNNPSDQNNKNQNKDSGKNGNDKDKGQQQTDADNKDPQQKQNDSAKNDAKSDQNNDANNQADDSKNTKNDSKQDNNPQQGQNSANEADKSQSAAAQKDKQKAEQQEARAQQWLNRLNSDIRVFLQNKFYLEDVVLDKH